MPGTIRARRLGEDLWIRSAAGTTISADKSAKAAK